MHLLFHCALRRACLLLSLLGVVPSAAAVDPPSERPGILSSAALQGDAALLRQAYESLHPGLHRYTTPADLERAFVALQRELDHDQPVTEAFLAFTRFTATVRCGHSYPNFANQPRDVIAALTAGRNRLPFRFVWIDGRMVVTANGSANPALARGSVVEAIDGVSTPAILASLLPLARADGHNDAKRVAALQVQGFDRFEAFDVYFPLVHPIAGSSYRLDVRSARNRVRRTIDVTASTHAERLAARRSGAPGDGPLGWTIARPAAGVAVLTMPIWVTFNDAWDWKGYLSAFFVALRADGTQHLVIDLRGNEGGSDVGDEIAGHLIALPLALPPVDRLTRYRRVPDALRPLLDTWDRSFDDWGDRAAGPDDRGFYRSTRDDDARGGSIVPLTPRFDGDVQVLVDAANSSATFQFAEFVHDFHLATLVGGRTGGNLRGINGGAFYFLRLPASRIEIDLPLIGTFPRDARPDRGLAPDVAVAPTAADIARGADVVLRVALDRATKPR